VLVEITEYDEEGVDAGAVPESVDGVLDMAVDVDLLEERIPPSL
jgi:hypothetical protein